MTTWQIKNNRPSELILGAVQIMKSVQACDPMGALLFLPNGQPLMREQQDYVRAAEVIRPGELSEVFSPEQLKFFDTPAMERMRLNGEIEMFKDGRSLKPKAAPAPKAQKSLMVTESDEAAESRALVDLLGGSPAPVKD